MEEEWKFEEWEFTVRRLGEAASIMYEDTHMIYEIDFCPFLERQKLAVSRDVVLRWYREAPRLIKEVDADAKVAPKILSLDFGSDFQLEMVKASKEGNADGVVIANRFFKRYLDSERGEAYFTAHGGKELREANQRLLASVKKTISVLVSATGGTYTGKHAFEYISLGAQNVQVLTYIMRNGFERAFKNLLLNPEGGLIISIYRSRDL